MIRQLFSIAGTSAATLVAVPAAAFTIASVQVQAYRATPQNPYGTQLYSETRVGTSVNAAQATLDGYASALSIPAKGGTVSTTAFALSEAHIATAAYHYDLQLLAPPTVSAKVKIAYSGSLSSWGTGKAFAFITVGDYYTDYYYDSAEFVSYDPAGKAKSRTFKGVVSYTLFGGVSVPFELDAGASVNRDAAFGTGTPGFAFAYLDPTVTIGGVPEPASWAMMIAGFGLVGAAARRRRTANTISV